MTFCYETASASCHANIDAAQDHYSLGMTFARPLHSEGASDLMMGRSSVNEPVRSTDNTMSKLVEATAGVQHTHSNRSQLV